VNSVVNICRRWNAIRFGYSRRKFRMPGRDGKSMFVAVSSALSAMADLFSVLDKSDIMSCHQRIRSSTLKQMGPSSSPQRSLIGNTNSCVAPACREGLWTSRQSAFMTVWCISGTLPPCSRFMLFALSPSSRFFVWPKLWSKRSRKL
jgi:hypothetical protein